MNDRECATGIRRSWELVNQINVGQSFSLPQPLSVTEAFRRIALDASSSYIDVYQAGLHLKHYNFILSDFSYFQFSNKNDGLRYAFYPNPFDTSVSYSVEDLHLYVSEGAMTEEEYLEILSESEVCIGSPFIRYEYAPTQYLELHHPSAHFHIGFHSENRWAVSKILTPFAFTAFILKNYYSSDWGNHDDTNHEYGNELNELIVRERTTCTSVEDALFTDKERRFFHFT